MNTKNEYMCPICGEGTLWTDFTDGFKWGRAYCDRCDCGGPEVRTGYDENIDAPWRADAIKQFLDVVNEHVSKRCEVEGMNREEAANVLWWASKQHYPGDQMDITEYDIEAINMAITALRGPQPDPITGLVPCGCGGRAMQEDFFDGFFYFGAIKCPGCEIEIRIPSLTPKESSDRVKVAWNTAMGWKGGAE